MSFVRMQKSVSPNLRELMREVCCYSDQWMGVFLHHTAAMLRTVLASAILSVRPSHAVIASKQVNVRLHGWIAQCI